MPVFCCFTINASDPDVSYVNKPTESPDVTYRIYQFTVPRKVWQDFGDGNFSIVKFLNHTELSSRIDSSLEAKGYKNSIKNRVTYVNREKVEWFCEDHPAELFYKDITFSHQKEVRIVIPDDKFSFITEKDRDKKYRPLNIGNVMEIVEEKGIKVQDILIKIIMRMERTDIS
jgi:hypothetical protein